MNTAWKWGERAPTDSLVGTEDEEDEEEYVNSQSEEEVKDHNSSTVSCIYT